jgi:hypothetical protein
MNASDEIKIGTTSSTATVAKSVKVKHVATTANAEAGTIVGQALFDVLMSCKFRQIHRPFRPADVARELNKRGILSPRGRPWSRTTATRLLKRFAGIVSAAGAAKMAAWEGQVLAYTANHIGKLPGACHGH